MRKRKAKSGGGDLRVPGRDTEPAEVAAIDALAEQLAAYLPPEQIERVRGAYAVSAHAHARQRRKSGEPYITHPLAVASILAGLRLDAETIIAAILHDTLEDTGLTRVQLEGGFGAMLGLRPSHFYATSTDFVSSGRDLRRLQARYGDHIDFPAWIATMEVDDIIAMKVGQLVEHILESLA